MHERYEKTAFMMLLGIISIMRGEKSDPGVESMGLWGAGKETSESMFLLVGYRLCVCAALEASSRRYSPRGSEVKRGRTLLDESG